MSRMAELAERCEAAAGPDNALERDISKALGIYHLVSASKSHFTASLDAAKTLWPGEVPHLIPSDPRICTAMALRARAATQGEKQ